MQTLQQARSEGANQPDAMTAQVAHAVNETDRHLIIDIQVTTIEQLRELLPLFDIKTTKRNPDRVALAGPMKCDPINDVVMEMRLTAVEGDATLETRMWMAAQQIDNSWGF